VSRARGSGPERSHEQEVARDRRQRLAAGAQRDALDGVLKRRARAAPPYVDASSTCSFLRRGDDHARAVGREQGTLQPLVETREDLYQSARLRVPQAHGLVLDAERMCASIREYTAERTIES
jgi:hypothetical protein